jgi:N-dimethylarginine dimethylaminohydrolase
MEFGADNLFKNLRDVLLAKPEYFGISFLDTPWQKEWAGKLDRKKAANQHEKMCEVLKKENVKCHFLPIVENDTEQKDARDVGTISSRGAIVATQKHIEAKKGEAEAFLKFCDDNEIPVLNKNEKIKFEGGDFFFIDDSISILGIGPRTKLESAKIIQNLLNRNLQVIPHKVPHHLDGALGLISENLAVVDERFLDLNRIPYLQDKKVISVSNENPMSMPTNFLLLKKNKILADLGNRDFNKKLEKEGVDVVEADVSELKKNGGGIRCMTLPILRT